MAESTIKYPVHYPVGCVICTATNTNPSSQYGGTWTLIDKEFKTQVLTGTSSKPLFTINTTNVNSISSAVRASFDGKNIYIRMHLNTKVALTDTTITLGTFDLEGLGMTTTTGSVLNFIAGYCTGGTNKDGVAICQISSSGVLSSRDVITRVSGGSIAASSDIRFFFHYMYNTGYVNDSFCDKFYWRRTA